MQIWPSGNRQTLYLLWFLHVFCLGLTSFLVKLNKPMCGLPSLSKLEPYCDRINDDWWSALLCLRVSSQSREKCLNSLSPTGNHLYTTFCILYAVFLIMEKVGIPPRNVFLPCKGPSSCNFSNLRRRTVIIIHYALSLVSLY